MSRAAWLLTGLAAILLVVGWFFLVWSPTSDEIDAVRADIETTQQQTVEQQQRAAELREVRDRAPEAAADLATVEVLVPRDPALPALMRQLQTASDDSGVRLLSVSPSRPTAISGAPGGLATIQVSVSVEGTFFQLVDLVRRLEDPAISGRGFRWTTSSISVAEYPALSMQLSAEVFSRLPVPPSEEPEEAPADEAEGAEDDPLAPEDDEGDTDG